MRKLIVGDIHGNYRGFMQALERCEFDYDNDMLISIGDVVDGHCDSFEVVEELLKIKNLVAIRGNHDDWFYEWIRTGRNPSNWQQGQKATGLSYLKHHNPDMSWYGYTTSRSGTQELTYPTLKVEHLPKSHIEFFENQVPLYIDDNRVFVHGGFKRKISIHKQPNFVLCWDRDLWRQALSYGTDSEGKGEFRNEDGFREIYIGHTSTQFSGVDTPMNAANIWNLDTGGGWFGFISIMDIDTKEYWQSDDGKSLYPEFKGRQ